MASHRATFPTDAEEFRNDERISFDQVTQTHKLEDERGEEWEFLATHSKWIPVMDEAQMQRQREAYNVEGVDENAPAIDPRKRKAAVEGTGNGKTKKQKAEEPRATPPNKAVYVESLPLDATVTEIYDEFSKYGVIAENAEENKPRIKLYYDDEGKFKGSAIIIYFRSESVEMVIKLRDETDLILGRPAATGPMRIEPAEDRYKSQKSQPLSTEQAKTKGSAANRDRQKLIKKNQEMNNRLADWDDDEPQALPETSNRWDKVIIIYHMFALDDLAKDPKALLEIKDDVREECGKFGEVTNVVIYDKEEEGIVSVRFTDPTAADAAVKALDGRFFDRRELFVRKSRGKEKFKKTKKQDVDDADDEERLEGFSRFIEGDGVQT